MSRIPNPFLQSSGQGQQQRNPESSSRPMPGFLLMTRPPSGSNSYGGGGNRQSFSHHRNGGDSGHSAGDFISFSPMGTGSNFDSSMKRGGGRGQGRSSRGGRDGGMRHQGFQGSPRFAYPYQHQQSPHSPGSHRHSPNFNTPRGRYNYGQTGDTFSSSGNGKFDYNNGNSRRGRGDRGPISDIPIDKFISPSMVQDPWAKFDVCDNEMMCVSETVVSGSSPVVASLDDSEIVIDSDASVIVENSYEDGVSGMEGDNPPAPSAESELLFIATSSTSEKDTGSDTASDG